MKLFLKGMLSVMSAVAAIFAVVSVVLVIMGYRPFMIASSSMEPLYKKGSLAWVDTRTELDSLAKGDVIAYRSPANTLVLHRLVDVQSSADGEMSVLTRGDANPTTQEVKLSRVNYVGREAFTIPRLGNLVSSASGWAPVLIVLLIILACIPHFQQKRQKAGDHA